MQIVASKPSRKLFAARRQADDLPLAWLLEAHRPSSSVAVCQATASAASRNAAATASYASAQLVRVSFSSCRRVGGGVGQRPGLPQRAQRGPHLVVHLHSRGQDSTFRWHQRHAILPVNSQLYLPVHDPVQPELLWPPLTQACETCLLSSCIGADPS